MRFPGVDLIRAGAISRPVIINAPILVALQGIASLKVSLACAHAVHDILFWFCHRKQ